MKTVSSRRDYGRNERFILSRSSTMESMREAAIVCSSLQRGHFTTDLAVGLPLSVSPTTFNRMPHLHRQEKTVVTMTSGIIRKPSANGNQSGTIRQEHY
jgi:hypothetical protein